MVIAAEMTLNGFVIHAASIGRRQEDPSSDSVSDEEKARIVSRIKRALEAQGERVTLIHGV